MKLATLIREGWTPAPVEGVLDNWEKGEAERDFLKVLVRMGDADLIQQFLNETLCAGRYHRDCNEPLRETALILGWSRFAAILQPLVDRAMPTAFSSFIELLALLAQDVELSPDARDSVRSLAESVVGRLPTRRDAFHELPIDGRLLETLLEATGRLGDRILLERAVQHLQQHSETYTLDDCFCRDCAH